VLPVFIEEKRKEYLEGLYKGYEDISKVLDALEEIKKKIESTQSNSQNQLPDDLAEKLAKYEQTISSINRKLIWLNSKTERRESSALKRRKRHLRLRRMRL